MRLVGRDIADSPDFIRSFETRFRTIVGIHHAGIAPIHDYWREPGGAYLVSAHLRGESLADRLPHAPLVAAELQSLVQRIGGALVAASNHEVVHGQISAHNVVFDQHGTAFLTDFALVERDDMSLGDDVRAFAELVTAAAEAGVAQRVASVLERVRSGELSIMSNVVDALLATLHPDPVTPTAFLNPYKGLQAFDQGDAADYFGRDDLVAEIVQRLDSGGRFVMLVGASGSGKSSLARAGLLPRLRDGNSSGSDAWFVSTMLPGGAPFRELAEAVARVATGETPSADELSVDGNAIHAGLVRALPGDGQLLLVIDQFEELFTLAPEVERGAFLAALLTALTCEHSRLRVVATLRGDFYDRPLGVPGLGAVVRQATVAIAAMTASGLEAAIVRPAERVGRRVEGALVAELVTAGVSDAASLPALQFALYELSERCGEVLTLDAYREIGGLEGAIAERAEDLYRAHPEDQAEIRRMFEQLVVVFANGDATRRPALRAELAGGPGGPTVDRVVERWTGARLLTVDRDPLSRLPTVELAHEALLRHWPRLREWLEEDRAAFLVVSQVRQATADWENLGRDEGALWRGSRLSALEEILSARMHRLSAGEQAFVDASRAVREAEERVVADRLTTEVRTNRRLRRRLGALAGALVLASSGASSPSGNGRSPRANGASPPLGSWRPPRTPASPTTPSERSFSHSRQSTRPVVAVRLYRRQWRRSTGRSPARGCC